MTAATSGTSSPREATSVATSTDTAPLLNAVVWPLQIWTANYAGALLDILGMPALVSGDRIIMSDGLFVIIETCSGLRSIETLSLLAVLMVDLFRRRGLHALLVLAVAPGVAFFINGFRALGLILNPHAQIASIHNLQGIVMLLGGVLVLYFWDGLLDRLLPGRTRISDAERRARARAGSQWPFAPRVGAVACFVAVLFGLSWLPPFAITPVRGTRPHESLERELGSRSSTEVKTDWLFLGKASVGQTLHRGLPVHTTPEGRASSLKLALSALRVKMEEAHHEREPDRQHEAFPWIG